MTADIEQATLPATMKAMVMNIPGQPLVYTTLPLPVPFPNQVMIKVIACGICRTDLHIADGELAHPKLPLIPGHEIIGTVAGLGSEVTLFKKGDLVGIPWMGFTCGHCSFCLKKKENLCENALFTGYTIDGGFAEYTVACQEFCFPIVKKFGNPNGSPLLCAGLIGYRSYTMIDADARHIGIYGFGAAAHILVQIALHQGKKIYAFTRKGDLQAQQFALRLGASWAGDSTESPPISLDSAIIFASEGELIPVALGHTDKGGTVVCGGIHMSDIPSFPYSVLWNERTLRSVANLTRKDAKEFLTLAATIPVETEIQTFHLHEANEAISAMRSGKVSGATVLVM